MSSKTDRLIGYKHTVAESIFDDDMMAKYEAGEQYYVELYNLTNEIFPEMITTIGITLRSQNPYITNSHNI